MKYILFLLFLFTTPFLYSQQITKQVADSACICLNEKLPQTSNEQLKDTISSCIGVAMANNTLQLFKEHKLEGFTVENIQFISSKIVARLEKKCESFKALKK